MRRNLKELLKQSLIGYMIVAVAVLTVVPADVQAMFLPSGVDLTQGDSSLDRQQNLERLQRLLESRLISQRLSDLGFSQGEVSSRLNRLSDEQVHFFSSHLESLQTGGDGLGIIIALLVIAVLVVVLLEVTGHRVLITK
ncbi:MAG TPA: PA2779 family protein [Nitrospiria bacterium]|jgi:hypothetical protein|nr:PA2779 family protein [Nitrospiria bacterium]